MRKTGLQTIYDMAKEDKDIVFIGSDLGVDTLKEFKDSLPDQFIMEGVSEGHLIGMAAGMAHTGATVFVNTIATFLTRRALDQILVNLCLDNAKVRIYGNGGGLVYGPLGVTHTAIEDLSTMCALPNMTVLAPADSIEMDELLRESKNIDGPIYIRLGKGGEKVHTLPGKTKIGKAKFKKSKIESKVLICTTGVMLQRAEIIREEFPCDILHFPTVKPLDTKALEKYAPDYDSVFTMEENVPHGGFGEQIGCFLLEKGITPKKFHRFTLPSEFINEYARQEELFESIGLDPKSLVSKIREFHA